jgi:hypothetical protein
MSRSRNMSESSPPGPQLSAIGLHVWLFSYEGLPPVWHFSIDDTMEGNGRRANEWDAEFQLVAEYDGRCGGGDCCMFLPFMSTRRRKTDFLGNRNTQSCTPSTRSRYVLLLYAPRFPLSVPPRALANSAPKQTRTQLLGAIQPRTVYNMKWAIGLWRGMSSVVVGAGQFYHLCF